MYNAWYLIQNMFPGRTFIHPLLPSPFDTETDQLFMDIGDLERAPGAGDVISNMK